jgi:hypothetical protein
MTFNQRIITDIELHSVEGIRECFRNGVHPNDMFQGRSLFEELLSEYTRSPRFKECVRAFVDHGLDFEDRALLAVLLDDDSALEKLIRNDTSVIRRTCSFRSAYTPMENVTFLHVCAEFNHVRCAKVLVSSGADVNAKAGLDRFGFGGQTPVFHTVNQNSNQSIDMLNYLLSCEANLDYTVRGLIWGRGYDWETFIPAVNPLSYAMMGLLPQMHRNEFDIADVVSLLLRAAYGIEYRPSNVPTKYLGGKR